VEEGRIKHLDIIRGATTPQKRVPSLEFFVSGESAGLFILVLVSGPFIY
jgi:hypothetical protein